MEQAKEILDYILTGELWAKAMQANPDVQKADKLLSNHRLFQNIERLKLGDRWQNTNYIFTTYEGGAMHPDTITSWFRKFIIKHNLPRVSVHSLRHPYVKPTTKK